eukprot:Skav225208  [mRNA]  locus=scaffold1041:124565:131785:- [translate_table: standard]
MQFQCVVLYGLPANRPGAQQFNSDLIDAALDAVMQLPIPSILMGDLNGNPLLWPCGERLKQLGFLGLDTKYKQLYGSDMPPTCREATTIDMALVSLQMHDWISKIQVLPEPYFDTHKVVLFDLRIPTQDLQLKRYVMPKSFLEFDMDKELWSENYRALMTETKPDTLQTWADQLECSVDATLRQQRLKDGCSPCGLPRRYRGRCKIPRQKKVPMTTLTVKGRPADFQPCVEVHTRNSQLMVRQVRRLECLQRLLAKQTLTPVQDQVARQDWLAICRCTAFGEDFLSWCMTWLDLGPVAIKYPTHEQVFAIGQLVRFHTDAALQEDRRAWLDKLAYDRRLDQRNRGSSKAFARLKRKQIEPLQQLHLPCEEQAIVHEQERGTLLLYLGNASRQAVLATRRFLIQASDQTKAQFLEVATQHSGVTHKCRGPAGALAHYLNRLSWTLDAQGYLHVDAFRKFKLVELSARKITDFLLHAWSADLLTLHSSRKAWRGHAPIHPQDTQRVISSFDTKHHKALLNELSGAFQTASQQAKWDAQTSPECPYCGEHDTREHRIFSCAATLHVRDEHREQTIHRAEIYALVLLCEHFHDIDVATDSQSALSLANKCVQLEHPRDLYNHSEPDLALRLWEAVREGRYNFRKVKAHTDIQTCADLLERFDRIGNKVADETAQSMCKCFNLRMIQEADGIADRLAPQHDSLKDYFSYFLELQTSRAKLRKQSRQFEQHTRHDDTRESVAVKLARYSLDTVWTPDTVRFDHSRDNAWGPTWGRMFFSWLSRFRWPSDGEEVDFQKVGVTWVELALSLMLTTGQWLPLRRKGQDGKDRLVVFSSAASLTGYQVREDEAAAEADLSVAAGHMKLSILDPKSHWNCVLLDRGYSPEAPEAPEAPDADAAPDAAPEASVGSDGAWSRMPAEAEPDAPPPGDFPGGVPSTWRVKDVGPATAEQIRSRGR